MSDTNKAMTVIEHRPVEAMSPVVRMGMEILGKNPSPETLRELLAVNKEWEANEARKAFAVAMVDLKRALPSVLKHDKTVHFNNTHYTHTTLASASEQLTPVLAQYGFAATFKPRTTEQGVAVTCQIRHAAGHAEEETLSSKIDVSNAAIKNPIQQMASSITYLKRYLLLSMLGIATADMPDADDEAYGDEPAPSPDRVDTARNMRAVEALKKYGKTRADAEEYLGKTIAGWTSADLGTLKAWLAKSGGAA